MRYETLTEKELLESFIKDKDHVAFSEIFNRHWGMAYLHALKLLKDEDESKDIVQEIFTTLWNNSETLNIESNFKSYLFSAVRNKALNHFRSQNVRSGYIEHFAIYNVQHYDKILQVIEEKELLAAINAVVDSLPPRMREIFELSRYEHLSHKEIAQKLNLSSATIKRQISNALSILKNSLDKPESLILIAFLHAIK
jgi:RNA polymerase sigma-70 factor (family 1)